MSQTRRKEGEGFAQFSSGKVRVCVPSAAPSAAPDHFSCLTLAVVVTLVDPGLRVGQVKLQSFECGNGDWYYCAAAPDAVT